MAATSVQLYSVRDAIAADLGGTLDRVAAIGLTNVEPYGFVDRADEYLRALDAAGLVAPSAHAPVIDADEPQQAFAAAAALGVTTLIDPFIPAERWQTLDQIAALADRVNALTAQAAAHGLAFGYHNHAWELSTVVDGRPALEVFVDRLDDAVRLEVDTYWASVGGADAPALLRALGDRVPLIHVKDGTLDGATEAQVPAGSGEVDVRAVLAAAPDAIRVIEFDDYRGDVFDGIAASFAWLKENDR